MRIINRINILIFSLIVSLLFNPLIAKADSDIINNDFNDERYWANVQGINLNDENGFSGIVKYVADEDNGEFFLYFSFYDKNLNPQINDKITICFTVENSNSNYLISIDENGFTQDNSVNINNVVDIYYSFEQASTTRKGGTLYAGFKLKNTKDRQDKNYITCDYYFGDYIVHTLLSDILLDMSGNITTKKQSSSISGENKNDAYNSKNNNSGSANKNEIEQSTKFSGSGKITEESENNSTDNEAEKFNPNQNEKYNENTELYDEQYNQENAKEQASVFNYSSQRSKPVKIMICVGSTIIAIGVICIGTGLLYGRKNKHNMDNNLE